MDKDEVNDRRLYGWYKALRTTIKPKENKKFFQTFKYSFSGKEVVSVFETVFKMTKDDAIEVGELIFDKKLIVHVAHKEKFKPKANSFYRFTNERRSLRHSIKTNHVKEDVLSEITKLLNDHEQNGTYSSPVRKRSNSHIPTSPKKPPVISFESTSGTGDIFDNIQRSSSNLMGINRIQSRSMDSNAKARSRRMSVKMEPINEVPITRVLSFEEPVFGTEPVFLQIELGSSLPSTSSLSSTLTSPAESPQVSPRSSHTDATSSGGTTPRGQIRGAAEVEESYRSKINVLKNAQKSFRKPKNNQCEDLIESKKLVSFFKNRKMMKNTDAEQNSYPEAKVHKRLSSDLGKLFISNTPTKNELEVPATKSYDVAWLVDAEKHTHTKKRKSVLQRKVDIFQFESIEQVLDDKDAKDLLTTFAAEEFADENIKFWDDLKRLHKETLLTHRIEMSKYLYQTYVDRNAPLALNITNSMVQYCLENYNTGSDQTFYEVEMDVLHSLCDLLERLKFSILLEKNRQAAKCAVK